MTMRVTRAIWGIAAGGLVLSLAAVGRAEEEKPPTIEERVGRIEEKIQGFLGDMDLGGYVESSFSWSSANAPDNDIVGRSFDRKDTEFMLNAFQLTLSKPVATDKWDAGFSTKLLFGQNATLIQSAGLSLGGQGDLEEGYVVLNAPLGNGLQFKGGKWVTLMGVEVIEDILNPTWSEGNQFLFAENFTGTGLEVSYRWTDMIDTQFRVYNGWDVVEDNNEAVSFMGRLGIAPLDGTLISIVPYGGPEQSNNNSDYRAGVNVVVSQKVFDHLTLFGQADYGHEDQNKALPDPNDDAQWWALGLWGLYDMTDNLGIGFRADYFDDQDGARTSGAPFTAPYPVNTDNEMWSLTVSLNSKLWEHVLIRPEVRYDHSSVHDAFGDSKSQFTLGMSVAYILL